MILLSSHLFDKLLANGKASAERYHDHVPVVKFFNPVGRQTWLITEVLPDDHDTMFGLCDLGHGMPELGYVSLTELQNVRTPLGTHLERDLYFTARHPITVYAHAARSVLCITEDAHILAQSAAALARKASPDAKVSHPPKNGGGG